MNVYELENIFGLIYNKGNVCFGPDGYTVYTATGNRLHCTNLQSHVSIVFPIETFLPIKLIAIDSRNSVILVIDEGNMGLLISTATRTVLSSMNFKEDVESVSFSPDYPLVALGFEKKVEVWRIPILTKPMAFTLVRQYRCFLSNGIVKQIVWRKRRIIAFTHQNRGYIIASNGDVTHKLNDWRLPLVSGVYMNDRLHLVSQTGFCAVYKYNKEIENFEQENVYALIQAKQRIVCGGFGGQIFAGNIDGEIVIFETSTYTRLHAYKCDFKNLDIAVSSNGNCIALGNRSFDFLTVYEWKTESYLLKSTGHANKIISQAIAPNGQYIATGDNYGNLKIWNVGTGDAICSFSFKQDGDVGEDCAVRGITFSPNSLSVIGVGGNGKILVFDMIKKKCYRILRAETSQLDGIVIEPRDGDIIAAYSAEDAKIFLYSIRTSKLLDVITGHAGPITDMCIHPITSELATTSWDKTLRCVNFLDNLQTEVIDHPSEVMSVSVNSIGSMYVTACRDGYLYLYGCEDKAMIGLIAYRNDFIGGVKLGALTKSDNIKDGTSYYPTQIMAKKEKYVNAVKFLADNDEIVICGGNSKYITYYNVVTKSLVYKSIVSKDYSYSNVYDFLHTKKLKKSMEKSAKKTVQTQSISISPAGKTLSILTESGVQLYTSGRHTFQPYCLTEAITPEATKEHLTNGNYVSALVFALHLNDENLINQTFRSIPMEQIVNVANNIPIGLLSLVLEYLTKEITGMLFHRCILFIAALLKFHINVLIKPNISLTQTAIPSTTEYLPHLRNLFKSLNIVYRRMASQSQQSLSMLNMCLSLSHFLIKKSEGKEVDNNEIENMSEEFDSNDDSDDSEEGEETMNIVNDVADDSTDNDDDQISDDSEEEEEGDDDEMSEE